MRVDRRRGAAGSTCIGDVGFGSIRSSRITPATVMNLIVAGH